MQNRSPVLPFSIKVAQSTADLHELVELRYEAYSRHRAPGAERLISPEEQDRGDDAVLLLARSNFDGSVVGSVRIQTRLARALMVESAMQLPADIARGAPIELMRGSVKNGVQGRLVAATLAKASFQIAEKCGFSHIIVTCRTPVNFIYRAYCFDELLDGEFIDLPYSPGAKHQVLSLPVIDARFRWQEQNPSLYRFMVESPHPEIEIDYDFISQKLRIPKCGGLDASTERALVA